MTQRLYYDDAYKTRFEGTVTQCESAENGLFRVRLDVSAFYPTSGGQPHDVGALGGANVVEVSVEDGDVVHLTDRALNVGETVRGEIDWPRRFDHMQQHAGDHMIAGALHRLFGGVTIGLHTSDEFSTIDVAMPDGRTHLTAQEIAAIENEVNAQIQRNDAIRCWFPSPEELEGLPLRKKPTVSEHVRVVAIGDTEMVACGGTHPSRAGEVGLVKILYTEPARGKMRLAFVAGMRAVRNYRAVYDASHAAANLLTTSVERLEESVRALKDEAAALRSECMRLKQEKLLGRIPELLESASVLPNGVKVISGIFEADGKAVKELCAQLIRREGVIALIGARDPKGIRYIFARSASVTMPMNALLKACTAAVGGKGGGQADFAQGSGDEELLGEALRRLQEGGLC